MPWVLLVVAGLLEVVWAFYMKQSQGFTRLVPSLITVVAFLASFILLSAAMKALPLGTAYPVWTGIGAVGAFLAGVFLLSEAVTLARVIAVVMIVMGLMLMKLSTP